jgi:acyl-CoA synthetase (AMP-forming)/AMP-acid ligase II
MLDLLEASSTYPTRVAFLDERDEHTSFGELWTRSGHAATALGYGAGDGPVAGLLSSDANVVACLIGALRTGRDFASLPLPGRAQPPAEYGAYLRRLLRLSGARLVVAAPKHLKYLTPIVRDEGIEIADASRFVEHGARMRAVPSRAASGRLLQFTSGTTGRPKGIYLTPAQLESCIRATLTAFEAERGHAACYWVPLSHDMGLVAGLLCSWSAAAFARGRGDFVCMSPERFLARPLSWLEACARYETTHTAAPTFAYAIVAKHLARSDERLDLSRLRSCVVGAEPVYAETLREFNASAEPHGLRSTAICPGYGMAEATLTISMKPPDSPWREELVPGEDGVPRSVVSCGRPVGDIEVCTQSAGTGELLIRGSSVATEFLPERQREPHAWLQTGDLGCTRGGEVFVCGRTDDVISVGGRKLFASELEQRVGEHEIVRPGNCAIVSDSAGRYVVLFEPATAEPARGGLEAACRDIRDELARTAGVGPSEVGCVRRGTLPKTGSGKLRRNLLVTTWRSLLQGGLVSQRY